MISCTLVKGRVPLDSTTWPNFFIVGAVKCGTTTLYSKLKKHPQVFLPEMKEPHYFSSRLPPPENREEHCIGNTEAYLSLYAGAEEFTAVGDASPSYLWDEESPQRIVERAPGAKIVMSLRDPVSRAYSQYWMDVLMGWQALPFDQALKRDYASKTKGYWTSRLYVELGLYAKQVERYITTFGRDRVLVVMFEDLVRDSQRVLTEITEHIGVDALEFGDAEDDVVSRNAFRRPRFPRLYRMLSDPRARHLRHRLLPGGVRQWLHHGSILYDTAKPAMDPASRKFLQDIFEPDLCELEALLGRRMPELRKSWF